MATRRIRPTTTLDGLARDFVNSPSGAEPCADRFLSALLADYLTHRNLSRIACDRDAFDMLLNRVLWYRRRPGD